MSGAAAGAIADAAVGVGASISSNAVNWQMAKRNLAYQRQATALNLLMQKEAWDREDTAVQRRKADLIAAGFSPVLAAGAPASTMSPIKIDSLQNKFEPDFSGLKNIGSTFVNSMMAGAQIDKINAETQKIEQQRRLDLLAFPDKLSKIKSSTTNDLENAKLKAIQQLQQWIDAEYQRNTGFKAGQSSEAGRTVMDAQRIIQNMIQGMQEVKRVKDQKAPSGMGGTGSSRGW